METHAIKREMDVPTVPYTEQRTQGKLRNNQMHPWNHSTWRTAR